MTCEVWLEVRDAGVCRTGDALEIGWRWQVRSHTGSAEISFVSPLTKHTEALLHRYVREFRSWRPQDRDHALTAERTLLSLGRALGNALVDAQYQLLTFCEWLEREGVAALHVAVVADNGPLQQLPWELLILPDSQYVLAAACAAFVRCARDAAPLEQPARLLDLNVERPLGYLRLGTAAHPGLAPAQVSTAWTQLGWQGALHYRLEPASNLSDSSVSGSRHIVHWAGVVTQRQGVPHLMIDDTGAEGDGSARALSVSDFVARALGAELLILEPSAASAAADEIALAALHAGIDNVLLLSEPCEAGWPNDWVSRLLEFIRTGLGLQQAVVETRKSMQRVLLEARRAEVEQPHGPQQWHALRHYSRRDVVFFATAPQLVPFEATESYSALRRSLFGFDSNAVPPSALDLGDPAALALLGRLRASGAVLVDAVRGGGMTHALHRLALFARANGAVDRAYYWDFAREAFTLTELLQMVASTHGQTDPDQVSEDGVLRHVTSARQLLVLDNLDALTNERVDELMQFAERVSAAGSWCVLATHARREWQRESSAMGRLTLSPLSELECIRLLQASASGALALGPGLFSLLDQLHGNPLLIRRVFAQCTQENLAQLQAEASESYGMSGAQPSAVELFHARRWRELEPHWQRLLLAWLPLDGLYLQILMIAVDRPGGEQSEAGRKLWATLGAPAAVSCASAIACLQASGFVVSSGVGASLDRAALRFLRAHSSLQPAPELETQLAHLLCEGILRLLERRGQAAAPDALTGHLVANRALMRRQVETTLRACEYTLGTRAFVNMHALLVRAQLAEEANHWARSLLELVGETLCTHADVLLGSAWLSIALRATPHPLEGALASGVRYWAELLARGTLTEATSQRTLLPLVIALLEKVYDRAGDVTAYHAVVSKACDYYRTTSNELALIPQLLALAAAEHTLGNNDARDRVEQELVHGIAYAELRDGVQLRRQTLAALSVARLRRSDEPASEALLELIEREWDRAEPNTLSLSLRAELALCRAQWELAGEYFCQLWKAAVSGVQGIDIDVTARRLIQLRERLGPERFDSMYAEHAGAALTPEALGLSVS